MTQADRDRLVALKKAEKKLITQRQAAQEVGVSERQLRRMLKRYREEGDRAVVHALRGRASNRRYQEETQHEAIQILSDPVYAGFGPTLAAEYLAKRHQLNASKETVRKWMTGAGLWEAKQGEGRACAHVSRAAGAVWRISAMGHVDPRLAGRAGRESVPDHDDR